MKRRSPHAQIEAMRRIWPTFEREPSAQGMHWVGRLQPKSQCYLVKVIWDEKWYDRPYVVLLEPRLKPRTEGAWGSIPHLLYCDTDPELSGLCLFDPDGNEWAPSDLIAETTIKWVSEWLLYYELWHLTGEWLAPGIGPESSAVGQVGKSERADHHELV
jgi:hypothetical protein